MMNVRSPQFLTDLYRDLRDRRLLLPVVALAIALIAVPVALSSSSATAPAPLAPTAGAGGPGSGTAAQPAVLTEQLGVTNYRKRLEQFKSKDPFREHFALPKVTSKLQQSTLTEPLSSASTASTSSGSGSTSTSTATGSPSVSSTVPASTTPSSPSSEPAHQAPRQITKLVQRRIDVKVGPEGSLVKKRGVKQFTMLPNSATPVVAFLGTSENGKRAFFLVSTDVTSVSGDGVCLSSSSTCQYMSLHAGEQESFEYAPDSLTYKLKLLEIRDVVVKRTRG